MGAREKFGLVKWPALTFAAVWAASTSYLAAKDADWTFPIFSLAIFGVALTLLGLQLTRRADAPAIAVSRPRFETGWLLAYLALYAFVMLGWALSWVREAFAAGPDQEIAVMLLKLAAHVVLPAALLLALGASVRPLFAAGWRRPGFWPALVVLGAVLVGLLMVVSPSLKTIAALGAAPAAVALGVAGSFLWVSVEAGLNEEFFFRAVLQTRLAAAMKSPAWGIVVTSVLFALSHAPGLYLRGTPETDGWSTDPVQVAAFTIATLAPISILFGTLWARTRSLLLVVLLHGSVDVLPFTAEFMRTWGLA
jgi:membrane protease YdiL (CAAX protease family)